MPTKKKIKKNAISSEPVYRHSKKKKSVKKKPNPRAISSEPVYRNPKAKKKTTIKKKS